MVLLGIVGWIAFGTAAAAASPAGSPDLRSLTQRAPRAEDYPDADAIVLYEEISLTLHPDGLVDRTTRHVRKYLTPFEVDENSDPRIPFDAATQTLEFLSWRTVMASGEVVEKKDRCFNQVTPDEVAAAPDYASRQEMVSTHLGMEEGAVVEREYVVRDRAPRGRVFSGVEFFSGRLPVLEKVVRISVPESVTLRFEVLGDPVAHEVERSSGTVTHVWRARNLPGIPPSMVEGIEEDSLGRLVFSTAGSWEQVVRPFREKITATAVMTARLESALEDVTAEARDKTDLALAIHGAVCDRVRPIEYPFPLLGTECRAAEAVYETGYGHRLDKAVLLLAWLRGAGVEAEPVMVAVARRIAEDVPCAEQVADLWVVASVDGRPLWLDPLEPLASSSYKDLEGRRYLRLSGDGTLERVPERRAEANRSSLKVEATLLRDGALEGDARVGLSGFFSPYYAVGGTGDEGHEYVKTLASGLFGGVEVETWNFRDLTEDGVALGFHFRREAGEAPWDSSLALPGFVGMFDVPGFRGIAGERPLPLFLPGPFAAEVEAEVELWDGALVRRLPEAASESALFGSYELRCEEREGTVRFERRLEIARPEIAAGEYAAFRRIRLRDENELRATVWLGSE